MFNKISFFKISFLIFVFSFFINTNISKANLYYTCVYSNDLEKQHCANINFQTDKQEYNLGENVNIYTTKSNETIHFNSISTQPVC